ncbi:MAG: hypothetical protein M0R17_03060 [Candidatus Omnitrophica bacterium]|jgi:hypothetical protein|nr:hypothetical protein [Candidatus Omnitrophota bacterium]
MIDLFSINKTTEEQLNDLRIEIQTYQKNLNLEVKKSKIKLFYGNVSNFGSGVLLIGDPPSSKFFDSPDDKVIINLMTELKIDKYFITYDFLIPNVDINPKNIKSFSYFVRKLTDIIAPKLIVCFDEHPQFCFFKRKFLIQDFHGKQIGTHENIPIFTTNKASYYEERSKVENYVYKEQIKLNDWNAIKKKYEELSK